VIKLLLLVVVSRRDGESELVLEHLRCAVAPAVRITCFFVGRTHRHRGVADTALAGTLGEIARLGGGTVESYPENTSNRKVSGSFLHNGTVPMFERHGFTRDRLIGKHRWVVSRVLS